MIRKIILSLCFLTAALLTTAQQRENKARTHSNSKSISHFTQKQKPTSIKQELESNKPTTAKSKGIAELGYTNITPITLPYMYEGELKNISTVNGNWYDAYSFELTDSAKLYIPTDYYAIYTIYNATGDTIFQTLENEYFYTDALEPGKYYLVVTNSFDPYYFKLEPRPTDAVPYAYVDLTYNVLNIDKPNFGTLGFKDDPFIEEDDYRGYSKGFKIELQPGMYQASFTVITKAGYYNDATLNLLSEITGSFYDDLIKNESDDNEKSQIDIKLNFTIDTAGTYYIVAQTYADYPTNYKLVIEKDNSLMLNFPFTINGQTDETTKILEYNYYYFTNNTYLTYIPRDTIIQYTANLETNYNDAYIIFHKNATSVDGDYKKRSIKNNTTNYIKIPAGLWYVSLFNCKGYGNYSYTLSAKYFEQKITTDSVSLAQLLAAAPLVESVNNDTIMLGYEPTKFVNNLEYGDRYAYAYKMQLDSGDYISTSRIETIDDYLYIYRTTTDTFELWKDFDDGGVPILEIDSTTTYYFVFTSCEESTFGGINNICINKTTKPNSFKEVIEAAKEITTPYHETDNLGDTYCADIDNSVVAYRTLLTKGDILKLSMKNISLPKHLIMSIYGPDTTEITSIYNQYIDMIHEVDTTGYHYIVLSSAYKNAKGTFDFEARTIQNKTAEQLITEAIALEGNYGLRSDTLSYLKEIGGWLNCYKVDLDSAQIFYIQSNDCVIIRALKQVGDTVYNANLAFNLVEADSNTTYYIFLASYNEIGKFPHYTTPKSWPEHIVDGIHFVANDTINKNNSHLLHLEYYDPVKDNYYSDLALVTDLHGFCINNGESLVTTYRSNNGSFLYYNGEKAPKFSVQSTTDADTNYYAVCTHLADYKTPTNIEWMVHRAVILDTLLNRATAIAIDELPYAKTITCKQNLETQVLVKEDSYIHQPLAIFKVDMEKGDQLRFASSSLPKLYYSVYNKNADGYSFFYSNTFSSSRSDYFTATSADTYYVFVKVDAIINSNQIFDNFDDLYSFVITSPKKKTEVSQIVANCESVKDVDVESELSIRWELANIQLTATTINGTELIVLNDKNAWQLNSTFTEATYTPVLPLDFVYSSTADSVIKVLIAPATITYSASGNGTITYSGDNIVERNTNVTFNITAVDNYHFIDTIMVNGAAIESSIIGTRGGELQLTADSNIDVKAIFKKVPVVTVSYSAGENGSITYADSNVVILNAFVTFNIAANDNYVIDAIMVNGRAFECDIIGKASGTLELTATCDITVEVSFKSTKTDNENDNGVAIDNTEVEKALVYTQQRTLYIEGATLGANITVYSTVGSVIYTSEATSTLETIALPSAGMYIIHIDNQIEKVVCQ